MSDFRGKGTPMLEFQSWFCKKLKDDIGRGYEGHWRIPITTLLHDMIGDDLGECFLSV